jgi:hypothetical protein
MDLKQTDPVLALKLERMDDVSLTVGSSRIVKLTLHLDDTETLNAFCFARFVCSSVRSS